MRKFAEIIESTTVAPPTNCLWIKGNDALYFTNGKWVSLFKKEDFINITDRFNKHSMSLIEAIKTVPTHQRIDGLVITFEDINGDWRIYQFRGDAVDFFDENKWTDLYDYTNYIVKSITPDEEDLTVSKPDKNGNAIVSLKDRVYDESNFSGKGYKILRKNIQTIDGVRKNILTQNMINKPNTIYEIRYDFTLKEDITIPTNCVLKFEDGSLSNGTILLNDCSIDGNINCLINVILLGKGSNSYINSNWFKFNNSDDFDAQQYIQSIFNLAANKTSTIDFNNEKFYLRDNNSINNNNYNKSYNGGIFIYSNTTVNLYNTEFHSLSKSQIDVGNLMFTFYQDNITINGGIFFGNADTAIKYSDRHHGITIIGGKHIYVYNSILQNFNGDGIMVSRLNSGPYTHKEECEDVLLQNIKSYYNSRMGITVICGTGIVIDNCDIQHTGYYFPEKSNPGAAIDIEPNEIENMENIPIKARISNCFCKNNKIGISTGAMATQNIELVRHIEIYNNIIYGKCFFEPTNLYMFNNNFYEGIIYFRPLIAIINNNTFDVERLVLSKHSNFLEDAIHNIKLLNSIIHTNDSNLTENTNKNINIDIINCEFTNGYINYNKENANIKIDKCTFIRNNYLTLDNVYIYNSSLKCKGLIVDLVYFYTSNIVFDIPDNPQTYINSYNNNMNLYCYDTFIKANEFSNALYSLVHNETYNVSAYFEKCILIGRIINTTLNQAALDTYSKKLRDIYYNDNSNVYTNKLSITSGVVSYYKDNIGFVKYNGISLNAKESGTFSKKPSSDTGIYEGYPYFCTDKKSPESNKAGIIIYYKGNNIWVDSLGRTVTEDYPILTKGSTEQRPTLTSTDEGYEYYDSTLKKKILWNGTEWTNIDGTTLQI